MNRSLQLIKLSVNYFQNKEKSKREVMERKSLMKGENIIKIKLN